jgi:hypothetical protein
MVAQECRFDLVVLQLGKGRLGAFLSCDPSDKLT